MSGEDANRWTVDTLHVHIMEVLDERRARYEHQIESVRDLLDALDKRYAERFVCLEDTVHAEAVRAAERFQGQKEAVINALEAADRAVGKAEAASEKRFDSVNEFRAALADQTARLMPRSESEARLAAMAEKLDGLTDRVNRADGRGAGVALAWGVVVAVIGVIIGISGVILATMGK